MTITAVLSMSAKSGRGADLVAAFEEILPDTRTFEGCLGVTVHVESEDSDKLLLIERWKTVENYVAYNKWRMNSNTLDSVMSAATALPVTTIYHDVE